MRVYTFIDESGNTGSNFLDANQPDFFTAALMTPTDFDQDHGVISGL